MQLDPGYAFEILPAVLSGAVITLQITIAGFGVALAIGLGAALATQSGSKPLILVTRGYVEFFRSTPILIQLYFVFYVMPRFGVTIDPLPAGVVTLGLHYGAYTSEVFRAGIQGVARGQWEAAVALDFSRAATWIRIILPQAIPPVIPPMGGLLIFMFKDSPILMTIGIYELLGSALLEARESFRFFEPLLLVGAIFIVLSLPAAMAVRWLEARLIPKSTHTR